MNTRSKSHLKQDIRSSSSTSVEIEEKFAMIVILYKHKSNEHFCKFIRTTSSYSSQIPGFGSIISSGQQQKHTTSENHEKSQRI